MRETNNLTVLAVYYIGLSLMCNVQQRGRHMAVKINLNRRSKDRKKYLIDILYASGVHLDSSTKRKYVKQLKKIKTKYDKHLDTIEKKPFSEKVKDWYFGISDNLLWEWHNNPKLMPNTRLGRIYEYLDKAEDKLIKAKKRMIKW